MDAERLHQLAQTLHRVRPDYVLRSDRRRVAVILEPEELVVLDAMAAEGAMSRDEALATLVRSILRADPMLVRRTFTGTEDW